jgi:hypothetical protein
MDCFGAKGRASQRRERAALFRSQRRREDVGINMKIDSGQWSEKAKDSGSPREQKDAPSRRREKATLFRSQRRR